MRNFSIFVIVFSCLVLMPSATQAAKIIKAGKERLVLMPLRVGDEDLSLQGAMETALVEGLQQKYEVLSGEQVAQKAKEIFLKESRNSNKKECDETRCMQGIAEAFQAELIATTNVTKRQDGYFIALSIQNIFDNKVVYSKSLPCKNCDAYQVVDKLKELAGTSVQAGVAAELAVSASSDPADAETALWLEIQKGNNLDEYAAYLSQYPKGKYAVLAKTRMKKFRDEAAVESAKKEQGAWDSASSNASVESYQGYVDTYPQGRFIKLAITRLEKLKKTAPTSATQGSAAGSGSRDCPECPEMVAIPTGKFDMGSSNGEPNESPLHKVTIKKRFAIGRTEVTQGQWQALMGSNPSIFKSCGENCPVENVSWNDVMEYIQKLNHWTGKKFRLPTEAEWEYACRAGGQHEHCGGKKVEGIAWYKNNTRNATQPVASKDANAFGLFDMNGNVWEWVEDSYHGGYANSKTVLSLVWDRESGKVGEAPTDGSAWQGDGSQRVLRGGSWNYVAQFVRAASRIGNGPDGRTDEFGFRLARTLP